MYQKITNEYLYLHNKYKGEMSKDEKIRLYELVSIETNLLENNRTEVDTSKKETIIGYVWGVIAAIIGIGTFYKEVFGSDLTQNLAIIFLFITFIFLVFVFRELIKIDRDINTSKKIRLDEDKKIRKMYITKKVLKDLLSEEDTFSI